MANEGETIALVLCLASCGQPVEGPGRARIATLDTKPYAVRFLAGDEIEVTGPATGYAQLECKYYNRDGEFWDVNAFHFSSTPARGELRFPRDTAKAICTVRGET